MTSSCWEYAHHSLSLSPLFFFESIRLSLPERAPQRFSPTPTFRPSLFHQFEYLESICIDSTSWGICVWNSSTLQQSPYWTTRLPLSTLETPWSILSTELQYHHCLPLPLSCPVRPLSPLPCFFSCWLLFFPVPVQGHATQRHILCVP